MCRRKITRVNRFQSVSPDFAASTHYSVFFFFFFKGQHRSQFNKHCKLSLIESGLNKYILRPTCIKMGHHGKTFANTYHKLQVTFPKAFLT